MLGLLRFSLFINDIGQEIRHAKRLLFGDDLQIYITWLPLDLVRRMREHNEDISAISAWASSNRLRLNLPKTKIILIGNNRLIKQIDLDRLPSLGDGLINIPFVTQVRNLEVILDSKLSLHQHIASISSKVNGVLYKLQQLREYTNLELRKTLFSALVLPHVHYCSAALNG